MTIMGAHADRAPVRIGLDVSHCRPAQPPQAGHIPALDGVRGLAILFVLTFHFTMGMSGSGLAARLLARASSVGWCGVDLFFVLSGFLITGILVDARRARHRFLNFYARRALRIFPLYYGTLAACFAALPALTRWVGGFEGIEEAGIWLGLYGTNVLAAIRGRWFPLSHLWSLAVEEHYYMFWPAVVFCCGRRPAMRVCMVMVLVAFGVRAWLVSQGLVLAAYSLTICRMDALAIGSFLALAARGPGGIGALVPPARKVGLAGLVALGLLAGWRFGLELYDPAVQVVGYLLLDVVFGSLLVLAVASPPSGLLSLALGARPLRWLGRYSYGLYVFNSIFILAAEGTALLPRLASWCGSATLGGLLYVVAASACTLGSAWLSWNLFERHFLKLKRFFPSGDPASRPRPIGEGA